jgi:hypothetical protein
MQVTVKLSGDKPVSVEERNDEKRLSVSLKRDLEE